MSSDEPAPVLDPGGRWYFEHAALFLSTTTWAVRGAVAGFCVGWATRGFLWSLAASRALVERRLPAGLPPYALLPLALPACVWLIRRFASTARGHGTEAVIEAVHERSGRIGWRVAPVKLAATVLTLAFGGSVGKEGPCAQIGASITSLFGSLLRLTDADHRRLVICGIAAGFAAVFGTPVSGALFGIEVLYLGRIEYPVLFPSLVAGIVAHLVCGVTAPVPALHVDTAFLHTRGIVPLSIVFGAAFGLVALLMIESLKAGARVAARFAGRPYLVAAAGGALAAALYAVAGDAYAGLGTESIEASLLGTGSLVAGAFLFKVLATTITLESGGSGGIVTPLFFVGATSGALLGRLAGLPPGVVAAFGLVSVLAAAANTPIAAAVMGMELLPGDVGVYAALCAGTAFLIVGHRSVYASQRLGFLKSAGIDLPLDVAMGEVSWEAVRLRPGSMTERVHETLRRARRSMP
jgi:H+/Cl- antiporter ClcA